MNICLIPARGGSKRIPRKNIRYFRGKPMISWSIEAAKNAPCIDIVIVSTDDNEIAEIALSLGAQVPFLRPPKLANDYTGTIAVVAHAIEWLQDKGQKFEAVCCLYATAPFVLPDDIVKGYSLLEKSEETDFVFTACQYSSPIQRALKLDMLTNKANMLNLDNYNKRTQDLDKTYHDAGQFYWGRPKAWLSSTSMLEGSQALIIPNWRAQDIDQEDDWMRAELLHKAMHVT